MKKGKFKIAIFSGWDRQRGYQEQTGMCSKYLGFHKNEFSEYVITHLPTGLEMARLRKINHAREFIRRVETTALPIRLDKMTPKNCKKNEETIDKIQTEIENTPSYFRQLKRDKP